jgi:hypothetical protein
LSGSAPPRDQGALQCHETPAWLNQATIIAGGAMILLPETSVLGIRAVAGAAAIVLGGIWVLLGLSPEGEEQTPNLNLDGAGRLASDWLRRRRVNDSKVTITLTGAGAAPPVEDLEEALIEAIGDPIDLEVRVVPSELLGS